MPILRFLDSGEGHLIWNCGLSKKSGPWMDEWIDTDLMCDGKKDCVNGKDESSYACSAGKMK